MAVTAERVAGLYAAWESGRDLTRDEIGEVFKRLIDVKARITRVLNAAGEPAHCKECQQAVWFVYHRGGKRGIYTAEGVSHFADCPAAAFLRELAAGKPAAAAGQWAVPDASRPPAPDADCSHSDREPSSDRSDPVDRPPPSTRRPLPRTYQRIVSGLCSGA